MRAMRLKRKQMGLVELKLWLTPQQKEAVQKLMAKLTKD